ncbi:MAG: 4Fe-4S binding protein [Puniceicoccales bacterium]|jgi:[FeFe] hydrogenase (group B1/B3)|nr:4Fe-4S binding protein [Puniceicoccales bacterium]
MTPQKKEILINLVRAFCGERFTEDVQNIPDKVTLDQRDRSAYRALLMSALGLSLEDDDGTEDLAKSAQRAIDREKPQSPPLTVLGCACSGCKPSHTHVTDLCQNCVTKPCMEACRFGAIQSTENGSFIDEQRCKRCTACSRACPYGAIFDTIVPCEHACPVDAISKNKMGHAAIDFDKCIRCGKCIAACPFEAIQVRSQIIDVLKAIKAKKKVIAMMAPAMLGQFRCSAEQLHTAMKKIGFSFVYEVALGAESTSLHEAKDLEERLEKGEKFMTTSCCAAYNILVKKHIPEMKPFMSTTETPLFYIAEHVRREHGDGVLVFISPCLAKYEEVFANEKIDYTLNIEEVAVVFEALSIVASECAEEKFEYHSAKEAREFSLSGGVSRAVRSVFHGKGEDVPFAAINGIDRETVEDLKRFAKAGECDKGTLLEVMSCQGGCVGGGLACCPVAAATRQVKKYGDQGSSLSDKKKINP